MTYRQRANAILALSFLCFLAIFWWWYTHDVTLWEELLFFVIQSALIGSIADWFAVTALFVPQPYADYRQHYEDHFGKTAPAQHVAGQVISDILYG